MANTTSPVVLDETLKSTNEKLDAIKQAILNKPSVTSLEKLTDVTIDEPKDKQVLVYNEEEGKWENGDGQNDIELSIVDGALNQTYDESGEGNTETTNPIVLNDTAKETNSKLQVIVDYLQEKKRIAFNTLQFKIEGVKVSLSDIVSKKLPTYFDTYDDFVEAVKNGEIEEGQRFTIREGVYKQESVKTHLADITSGTLLDGDVAGAIAVNELNNKLITKKISFKCPDYSASTNTESYVKLTDYIPSGYVPISIAPISCTGGKLANGNATNNISLFLVRTSQHFIGVKTYTLNEFVFSATIEAELLLAKIN